MSISMCVCYKSLFSSALEKVEGWTVCVLWKEEQRAVENCGHLLLALPMVTWNTPHSILDVCTHFLLL